MANNLSIKVHVDLPTAADIGKKFQSEMNNIGEIKSSVKIHPEIDKKSIAGVKTALRKALGGKKAEGIGVKINANTGELTKAVSKLNALRRIAKNPIKVKIDAGLKGVDDVINKTQTAQKAVRNSKANHDAELLKQEREFQRKYTKISREISKMGERSIRDSPSGQYDDINRGEIQRLRARKKKLEEEFRSWGRDNNFDSKYINQRLKDATQEVNAGGYKFQRLSRSNDIKLATAQAKELLSVSKELYRLNEKEHQIPKTDKSMQRQLQIQREYLSSKQAELESSRRISAADRENIRYEMAKFRMNNAKSTGGRFFDRTGIRRTGITANMDVFYMLQQGAAYAAAAVGQLNEVDKAITKVTKVVPDSQAAVDKWKTHIYKDAASVGKSAPEFAAAVEQWATAGYNLKQSNRLAKASVMGSFVGEVPVEDMVRYMSVPLKAFQKEGLKSKDVINAMNEVSNKHAIEMNDLGTAYQKASSTVGATGTTFSQLTGIITAAQEGTRAGGDMIGTAYKTIGSRLAKMGTGLTKQDKTRAAFFKRLKVNLTDSNGNLKSTWDIMNQLGNKWDSLSKKDKNTAAQYAAGANHANIFQATMDNWKTAKKSMEEAQGQVDLTDKNHGSAYKEFDKQKQSIQFKLAQLQNTWTSLLQSFSGGREGIGQILTLLNTLGTGLDKIASIKGLSSTIRWGLIAAGAITARRAIVSVIKSVSALGAAKDASGSGWFRGVAERVDKIKFKVDELKTAIRELNEQEAVEGLGAGSKNRKKINKGTGSEIAGAMQTGNSYYETTRISERERNARANSQRVQAERRRNTKHQIDDVRQTTAAMNDASITMNRAATGANNLGKKTSAATKVTTKLGKAWNVVKGGLGVAGSLMGGVGLALDGVTIGMSILGALGVDPIKAIDKALHPAKYAAKEFNSEIGKTAASIDRTNKAIDRNGIVSGKLKSSLKSVKGLQKEVASAPVDGKGNITDDAFKDIKKKYNALAKSNGLELRIDNDQSAASIHQKVDAITGAVQQIRVEDIQKIGSSLNTQSKNINKALSGKNLDKLLASDSSAEKEIEKIQSKYRRVTADGVQTGPIGNYKNDKEYKDLKNQYRFGPKAASMWNTTNGKDIQDEVNKGQASIRKAVNKMAQALSDGTITKDNLLNMGKSEREAAILGALKKFNGLHGQDDGGKAEGHLRDALDAEGISKKQQDTIVKHARDDRKGAMISDMLKAGVSKQLVAAMAGIGAVYQAQYGQKNFAQQASEDQNSLESYMRKNKGRKGANAQYLIDPDTGFLNFNKLAKFNMGATTSKLGKANLRDAGLKFKNHMTVDQLLDSTKGLNGDPTKILNNIAEGNGKATTSAAVTVANNAWNSKNKGPMSGSKLGKFAAENAGLSGKKRMSETAFGTAMRQAQGNGVSAKQAEQAIAWRNKNFTANGTARRYEGARAQIGNQKINSSVFKQMAKGLNRADRSQLAKDLMKSKQLDKSGYKALQNFIKAGKRGKGTKPKSKPSNDDDDRGSGKSKNKHNKRSAKDEAIDKMTGTKTAQADRNIRTANAMMKQLSGAKKGSISTKALKNLESRMKSQKERDKLAQQLADKGKLSKGARNYAKKSNKVNLSKSRKQGEDEERAKQKGRDKVRNSGKNKSNNNNKIKVQPDVKSFKSKLRSLGKGTKVKVKVQPDMKGFKSKIKSATKGQKAKVKVTANTSGLKSKIKSATKGITSKVKVTANTNGIRSKIKGAVKGVTAKVKVSVSGEGKLKSLKSTLDGVHGKTVSVKASVSGTGKVKALRSAINGVHNKSVTVKASVSGLGEVQSLSAAIAAVHSKSVTITANKVEKGKSVVSASVVTGGPVNPLQSMSIVANDPTLMGAVNSGAANMGVDANSAMNGQKVTDYSDSIQNVNEDYWRYMDKQLYTGLPLDEQVNKLEGAVTQADEDMDKLINLSRRRIDLDNRQIAYQRSMQGAYQKQITDMINQLHKYGFRNNGNTITNLSHARDIHGDNASKVDDLLGKYQSAYQNFSEATNKIQELQTDIWQQSKNQQDYNNTKDQKMVEKYQRDLELINTAIDNQKNILERQSDSLSDGDYRMKLKNSSDQIDAKQNAVQQLLGQFNRLSVANFVGTKEADNAKNLLESLQSIRDSITENLDSIDELKKSMRDTQLNSIIEGLQKYTDNLNDSIDRLKNNVTNLQDGLLSGTTYSDLISSDFNVVNLNQQDAYTKSVNDRIALEKDLDNALDQFARKNVDRTAKVANQELQVEAQKYNQLLAMATEYSRGYRANPTEIQSEYKVSVETDKLEVGDFTHNQAYLNASIEYQKEMNALKDDYNEKMSKATTAEEKETLNQAMVYEQLAMQVKVYQTMIDADKQAVEDLKKQAQNPDMTTEQLKTITDQITEYEKNAMDAQNSIKDAIKGRFEYEKQLMDKQMDDYKRLSDTMSNLVTIADALHLDGETQAAIINQQYAATYREYDNYLSVLARLRTELSKYEKGSFEYNQLSSMINDYQSTLNSTVTSLLDITKNSFDQTLNSIQDSFEKSVNDGMNANQAKFDQDVWYNPMQKELKLEEMRLKITELEDKTVEKRIAALDAQERMSKAEADYVDKQLDLALAEQKLNNTINKKDVRYLEKDENGKFNWTYIADQDQVDAARQEVNQAKQALEDAKVSNRNDYIQKVEEVISGAKDGTLNQEEVKKRLEQLNNSYKFILKDIPTFDISKVEDILKAYDEYAKKNADIIKDYQRSSNVSKTEGYQEIVKGFGEQFKAVSKDLGEIFGKQLREALNLPNGIRNAYGTGKDESLTINGDLNLELPNVSNANEFAEALKTLPQIAKQYVSQKR